MVHSDIVDIVRGFFCGFMSGRLDRRHPQWRQEPDPQKVRAIIMEAYPDVANIFCHITFPIILAMRFDSFEAAQADMASHHFDNHTSVKLLMRYACGSKAGYEAMVDAYRQEMADLLNGHFTGNLDGHGDYFRRAVMQSHDVGFHQIK